MILISTLYGPVILPLLLALVLFSLIYSAVHLLSYSCLRCFVLLLTLTCSVYSMCSLFVWFLLRYSGSFCSSFFTYKIFFSPFSPLWWYISSLAVWSSFHFVERLTDTKLLTPPPVISLIRNLIYTLLLLWNWKQLVLIEIPHCHIKGHILQPSLLILSGLEYLEDQHLWLQLWFWNGQTERIFFKNSVLLKNEFWPQSCCVCSRKNGQA